jgi:hypothetical protein
MRLPNGERAVLDSAKLVEYCLSLTHPRGRHKARIFALKLGLTAADSAVLGDALLAAAATSNSVAPSLGDDYGQRYVIDFELSGPRGTAMVRSAWIVRTGESIPRFASCYVL